jgi:hypothetical protein
MIQERAPLEPHRCDESIVFDRPFLSRDQVADLTSVPLIAAGRCADSINRSEGFGSESLPRVKFLKRKTILLGPVSFQSSPASTSVGRKRSG